MFTGILHTHNLVVTLFLLIYLIKTAMLLLNRNDSLQTFSNKIKVPEMIISTLFLLTGIYLAIKTGNKGEWLWVKIACIVILIPLAMVAFKKSNKILALLSFLILVYVYGISETKSPSFKKKHTAINYSNADAASLGKTIYESQCVNCHGADGKSGLSGAKDLTASTLTKVEKLSIITNGKNAMKPYKNELTPEQIDAVADYVEQMQ